MIKKLVDHLDLVLRVLLLLATLGEVIRRDLVETTLQSLLAERRSRSER